MSEKNEKINSLKNQAGLSELLESFLKEESSIDLVHICTSDGFNLHMKNLPTVNIELDKMAALASTFCSLGQSAAENIVDEKMVVSSVESESGFVIFLKVSLTGHPCVLTVAAKASTALGEARYKAIRLAKKIAEL